MGERLFLMCDYSADPAWWEADGAMAELSDLALGEPLRSALWRWADWFELTSETQTLNADGRLRYFLSDAEATAFEREGLRLWQLTRAALTGRHDVGYASRLARRRFWDPGEPAALAFDRRVRERTAGYVSVYERAERVRERPEVRAVLDRLQVHYADGERVDLTALSVGVLAAMVARQICEGQLLATDRAALEQAGWPVFEGTPMPLADADAGHTHAG